MRHILDEIDFLLSECEGVDAEDLMRDRVLSRACVRSLEVIGEAVKNVSQELKDGHPEIDWRLIAGMRDKLILQYFGIDWDVVTNVLNEEIRPLKAEIETLLLEVES